jgi:hypothetical protein
MKGNLSRWTQAILASPASWLGSRRRLRHWHAKPLLEALEVRWLPTTIIPTTFADGGLGSGSLRDAVLQLNVDTGTDDDTIQLQAGTYSLTIQNVGNRHETAGLTGDLNLNQTSHRWIIQGAGSSGDNATIIDASRLQDRVFQIVNPGTQVVFQDLVIQGGLAQENGTNGAQAGTTDALGGGIFNNGANITLDNVVLQNNVARGGDGNYSHPNAYSARGSGFYSTGGSVNIADSTIAGNQAIGGNSADGFENGGDGAGGGIYATGGPVTISGSTIASNQGMGGRAGTTICHGFSSSHHGGQGGVSQGGGLYVSGGSLTLSDNTIASNQAIGGNGGDGVDCDGGNGGDGAGGGIYATGGPVTISGSTIASNQGMGGRAGTDPGSSFHAWHGGVSQGGGLYVSGGMLTLADSTIAANTLQGGAGPPANGGGDGGASQGGGLYMSGTAIVNNSTVAANTLRGGPGGSGGGAGGSVQGGGIYASGTVTVNNSAVTANALQGGSARGTSSPGGASQGGGVYVSGTMTINNSTIAGNTLRGGDGGPSFYPYRGGDGGPAQGGGLWVAIGTTAQVSFSTIAANQAAGGTHGSGHPDGSDGPAAGGGLYDQGMLQTRDSLLAGNTVNGPGTNSGPDLAGNLGSLGHNLLGNSAGGSGFDATDLLNVDPLLGPLQDNGGPTQTMALLPGSPAIDAGDNTDAPEWDQRGPGFRRIVNGTIDIGAFEVQARGHGRPSVQPLPDPLPVLSSPAPNALGPEFAISVDLPQGPAEGPGTSDRFLANTELSVAERAASGDLLAPVPAKTHGQRTIPGPDLEAVGAAWPNPPLSPEQAALG